MDEGDDCSIEKPLIKIPEEFLLQLDYALGGNGNDNGNGGDGNGKRRILRIVSDSFSENNADRDDTDRSIDDKVNSNRSLGINIDKLNAMYEELKREEIISDDLEGGLKNEKIESMYTAGDKFLLAVAKPFDKIFAYAKKRIDEKVVRKYIPALVKKIENYEEQANELYTQSMQDYKQLAKELLRMEAQQIHVKFDLLEIKKRVDSYHKNIGNLMEQIDEAAGRDDNKAVLIYKVKMNTEAEERDRLCDYGSEIEHALEQQNLDIDDMKQEQQIMRKSIGLYRGQYFTFRGLKADVHRLQRNWRVDYKSIEDSRQYLKYVVKVSSRLSNHKLDYN